MPGFIFSSLLVIVMALTSHVGYSQVAGIDQKVESLLNRMTLEEKIGQMNQLNGDWAATGPVTTDLGNKLEEIREGKIGSILNIMGVEHTRVFQEAAMKSRLKIPLLFGQDVIQGYYVTFPIPLAEVASWDLEAIEKSARIAATEAAASGLHWTFAPMVDIARDPRWGRVMEGAGEDTYLGSLVAKARVHGFQGKGLGNTDAVMACAKHFAAYGAAIGGRDYNSVDMSLRTLWEIYLPPFKAAKDAGVATFMNSFNDINGIPATGNAYLQRDILRGIWNFDGFVVSDWGSIGEMIQHGFVKDRYEAAEAAIKAGNDMDMESRSYTENLAKLVSDGRVPVEMIDNAVRRILKKKFEMGLFDDPFRFSNAEREKNTLNKPEFREAARDIARKSIVLLKNTDHLLPLSGNLKSIALIGPLVKAKKDLKGFWAIDMGDERDIISLYEGIEQQAGNIKLQYALGCAIDDSSEAGFAEAIQTALQCDLVVMAMGERADMTGEAKSKSNIHLPGVQEKLIQAIVSTGKPVAVILMAGRPMVFNWAAEHVPSILYTWWLGNQAGNAMADVLFGRYNPAGKLPITFPRSEGQIPIYYNYLNTGRPAGNEQDMNYRSSYIDLPNSPRYAFGHGLSYTTFGYSNLKFSKKEMNSTQSITVTFDLKNTGQYAGEEVVQLYLRDLVAQPVRPVKELKDFQKVLLKPGETKTLTFTIDRDKLSFYDEKLDWIVQPGEFKVMIGSASDDIKLEEIINYE
jgi:beta-glucosidase